MANDTTDARVLQGHRKRAEFALDEWGAWRGFTGSVGLRDAVAAALADERERCARIADEGARLGDEDGNPDVVAAARIIARKIRMAL